MNNVTIFPIRNETTIEHYLERTQKVKNYHHVLKRIVFQFKVKAISRKLKPKKVVYFKRLSDIFITGRTPEYSQNTIENRLFQLNTLKCGIAEIKQLNEIILFIFIMRT